MNQGTTLLEDNSQAMLADICTSGSTLPPPHALLSGAHMFTHWFTHASLGVTISAWSSL